MPFSSSPPKIPKQRRHRTSTQPRTTGIKAPATSTPPLTDQSSVRNTMCGVYKSTAPQPAFYSPSAAALAARSPLPTPENDESSCVCACPDEHPSIVRTVQVVVVPSAVHHHWYHTRFWFVVISPDEFDECCVAPRWYIYMYT